MASLLVSYGMTSQQKDKRILLSPDAITSTQPAHPLQNTRGLDKVFLSMLYSANLGPLAPEQ